MVEIRRVVLNTRGHSASDQHDLWQTMLSSALYPVRVLPPDGTPRRLDADFVAATARTTSITHGEIAPVLNVITPKAAAQASGEELELTISSSPRRIEVDRDRILVPSHHLVVHTGEVPCGHVTEHRDQAILLKVPLSGTSLDRALLRSMMLRPLAVGPAAGMVARQAAGNLTGPVCPFPADAAERYLIGVGDLLLRTAIGSQVDHQETRDVRRQQVLDYLTANLHRSELTALAVARALHMSRRNLYNLLGEGPGVAAILRSMRVRRARELLGDPAHAGWSVARIAAACGFTSSSAFCRVFKETTGHRPSDYR